MHRFAQSLIAGGILAVVVMGISQSTAVAQSWTDAGSKMSGRAFSNGSDSYYRGGYRSYSSSSYAPAQPQVNSSFSYAPSPTLKAGDAVVVTADRANLMVGHQTVGTAASGQNLKVLKVEGQWVGTQIDLNGKQVGGWIRSESVALAPATQQ